MDRDAAFYSAIEHLYQAALNPDAWLSFIDEFSSLTDLMGGQYFLWDEQAGGVSFSVLSDTFPDVVNSQFAEYWAPQCPLLNIALTTQPDRWLLCTRELDKAVVAKSPYHHEYLYPTGIRYVTGYRACSTTSTSSVLAWFRRPDQGPMGEAELDWLRRLQPHFNTASRLHRDMLRLRLNSSMQEGAIDSLEYPIILVFSGGVIAFLNRAAERWLQTNKSITVKSSRLTALHSRHHQALELTLRNAFEKGVSGIHAVPHMNRPQPYQMMVLPLSPLSLVGSLWLRPVTLIVVADPQCGTPLTEIQLRTLFQLTPAEARVAIDLAEGRTIEEICKQRGISVNTVRTQLKRAMQKTDSRRQSELVKTITTLPKLVDHCEKNDSTGFSGKSDGSDR